MYLLDACSFINFYYSRLLLSENLGLQDCPDQICIGELVCEEVKAEADQYDSLVGLVGVGYIEVLPSELIDFFEFEKIKVSHRLGDGETECMLWARKCIDIVVCTDDRKARRDISAEIGSHRVTGTIGLLRKMVDCCVISRRDAYEAYRHMMNGGGFLPYYDNESDLLRSGV